MSDWTAQATAALAAGPTALVTVLATEGSAPRGAGARMIVTAGAQHGTIGGGALGHRAAGQARLLLGAAPGSWRVQDYPLGPLLGQCCGGRVRLLVEQLAVAPRGEGPFVVTLDTPVARVAGSDAPPAAAYGALPAAGTRLLEPVETQALPLFLFGAGHVGRAIAARAGGLPLRLAWYDSRPELVDLPGVVAADEVAMVAGAASVPAGAAVLILTHDHALDYRLAAAALGGRAGFVGLIGSATKRARFLARLARDGVDSTRLTCPIGLPGIPGNAPEVIAIATLAQLLSLAPPA